MRGFVFMLEAVFAGILMLGFILFLAGVHSASTSADEMDFTHVLADLDEREVLRGYVYPEDLSGLESEVSVPGHQFSVQICSPGGTCSGTVPREETVYASSYYLSGGGSLQPREVRLYVW